MREAIFSAIDRKNEKEFIHFCNDNHRLLIDYFKQWSKVPKSIMDRAPEVNAYLTRLLTIARYFQSIGEPALMAHLLGDPNDNPIVRWRDTMIEAHARAVAGNYSQSNELLLGVLSEMENSKGSAVDRYRPKVYGLLGTNYFSLRDLPNARKYTALALKDCQRTGDQEGIRTYTENMTLFGSGTDHGASQGVTLPVARFRKEIARAQDLSDEVHYDESNDVLEAMLREMNSLAIGSQEAFRGKLYGLLGLNFFRLRKMTEARHYTELALKHCHQDGDEDGVRIYSQNATVIAKAQDI